MLLNVRYYQIIAAIESAADELVDSDTMDKPQLLEYHMSDSDKLFIYMYNSPAVHGRPVFRYKNKVYSLAALVMILQQEYKK